MGTFNKDAIAKVGTGPEDPKNLTVYEPKNLPGLLLMAEELSKTDLVGYGFKGRPENIVIAAITGKEMGLTLMQSLRCLYPTGDGKLGMLADLMVAQATKHKDCDYIRRISSTKDKAVYEVKLKQWPDAVKYEYTLQDAKDAGLLDAKYGRDGRSKKKNWDQYQRQMLAARCKAELVRDAFPSVAAGLYDPDELGVDIDAPEERPAITSAKVKKGAEDRVDKDVIDVEPVEKEDTNGHHNEEPEEDTNAVIGRDELEKLKELIETAEMDPKRMVKWCEDHFNKGPRKLEKLEYLALIDYINKGSLTDAQTKRLIRIGKSYDLNAKNINDHCKESYGCSMAHLSEEEMEDVAEWISGSGGA